MTFPEEAEVMLNICPLWKRYFQDWRQWDLKKLRIYETVYLIVTVDGDYNLQEGSQQLNGTRLPVTLLNNEYTEVLHCSFTKE